MLLVWWYQALKIDRKGIIILFYFTYAESCQLSLCRKCSNLLLLFYVCTQREKLWFTENYKMENNRKERILSVKVWNSLRNNFLNFSENLFFPETFSRKKKQIQWLLFG